MNLDAIIVMSLVTLVMGFGCFIIINAAWHNRTKNKSHHKRAK